MAAANCLIRFASPVSRSSGTSLNTLKSTGGPHVEPAGGERGAPRRTGDAGEPLDGDAATAQGGAQPWPRLDVGVVGETRVGRQLRLAVVGVAQRLADKAAARVAHQVQAGARRQQFGEVSGVLRRGAGERLVLEGQDPPGVARGDAVPLGGAPERGEGGLGVRERPVQEDKPRFGLPAGRRCVQSHARLEQELRTDPVDARRLGPASADRGRILVGGRRLEPGDDAQHRCPGHRVEQHPRQPVGDHAEPVSRTPATSMSLATALSTAAMSAARSAGSRSSTRRTAASGAPPRSVPPCSAARSTVPSPLLARPRPRARPGATSRSRRCPRSRRCRRPRP